MRAGRVFGALAVRLAWLSALGIGAVMATPLVPVASPDPGAAEALPKAVRHLQETLPPAQRDVLAQRIDRWRSWSAEERAAFAGRVASWDALPPRERGRRREAWQAWNALPAIQREQVGGMSREFAARPVEEREALRKRYLALDARVQHGWQLGPVLGADYWRLHGLLAQVDPAQRASLLAVLREMTAAQRAQLSVLAQRTPPQERDGLRRDLIATPPAQRQQWLWEQLDR